MATSGAERIVAPEPPAELTDLNLPVSVIEPVWFRICARRHPSPLFWSRRGIYRFDSENARWGVCYAAESLVAAFQEVFGNKINYRKPVDWSELRDSQVWRISTPTTFQGLELFGETLTIIGATLQCFVSNYEKSRRWGAALMHHPELDGLIYLGRRCGARCLAMFGDESSPREYQLSLRVESLGCLVSWNGFWPMLDRLKVRISSLPKTRTGASWSL